MRRHAIALGGAGLMLGVSTLVVFAQNEWTVPPDPPEFAAQSEPIFVSVSDIQEYKALPEYHEPDFVKAFVDAGKLPPVAERLPKEPLVFKTGNMPEGIGTYGDTMRHVIGGRPDGWNYIGGAAAGLGRHRHRHVRVPDPYRSAVPGQGRRTRAAPQPGQELGMVGRRPRTDHAPDRRRQVV